MKPPSVAQIVSRAKDVTKIAARGQPAPASVQAVVFTNPVNVHHCGQIKIIHLNRPSAHNAISIELLAGLRLEIESISRETDRERGTRAVIVASNDDEHFCVGADLKERRGFTLDDTRTFLASLRQTFNTLASLPIPTISAVHGLALGGGLELALCTNFRVVASTSFLGLPETRLGIIPGAGGTLRLPSLIGQTRAADLILTGRRVGAVEALGMGLCNRVVDVESGKSKTSIESEASHLGSKTRSAKELVHETALDMAMEICKGGPVAVNQALWAVKTGNEDKAYEEVLATKDRIEALVAFGEKRRPKFRGE